ncbi:MAG: acyl dehydratase [Sphingobium sp.]|jgi:acyl dehydratase|nr:MAG: acyl dehydratase [Sphingobium sp.]
MLTSFFEDLVVGSRQSYGQYEVTREEVIDFAGKYDAQPFHLSDEAAAATHFGRVAASGWHTCAMMMAMTVRYMQETPGAQDASLGAIGIDELRWLKPVFPGDVLRCESEIVEKIPSRSRPEMGVVKILTTVFNQAGEPVLTMRPILMIRTRPA